MELVFNLAWIAVSLAMVLASLRHSVEARWRTRWTPGVALLLLVVLLLPAISITDDLMAVSSPAEVEHMLQQDVLASQIPGGAWLDLVASLALLSASVRVLSRERRGFQVPSRVALLRRGFGRVAGVRPPPTFAFASL